MKMANHRMANGWIGYKGNLLALFHANPNYLCKRVKKALSDNHHSLHEHSDELRNMIFEAAGENCPEAQLYLATQYLNAGHAELSLAWYEKAVSNGSDEATFTLAEIYHHGKGVAPDNERAFQLYLRLANRGDVKSQKIVGIMCFYGHGCPQDKKKAAYWIGKIYDEDFEAQGFWDDNELWKFE
ncbi:MAG: sel1 repeat family protein [Ignavibacteriales bacterium]|nr:sel1 repeat family protein [Ignavibacteriales bacterium]